MTRYDMLIVGGGLVGATLACAMARSGLHVAVLEKEIPSGPPADDMDVRVSAITQGSRHIFEALGIWPNMVTKRIRPFRAMHVWDAQGKGSIHFDAAEIGEDALGYVIENKVMLTALWERLGQDRVEVLCPAQLNTLVFVGTDWHISLRDGGTLRAHFVVGADGPQSKVRELAHIGSQGWSYHQQAVVANVRTEFPHQDTAWQRFLPTGPLAFLPLSEERSSIVWSTTPEQAQALSLMEDEHFEAQLAEAFSYRLGRITHTSERTIFPLRLQYVDSYIKPGLALVGDAAHMIHPLAGQGVNLGLLDAVTLAEVVLDAHRAGKDYASWTVLRRYERWRRGPNLLMMAVMDGFKRLFGNEGEPWCLMRNLGLRLTDRAWPVKNAIMRYATGECGDLPRLISRSAPLP